MANETWRKLLLPYRPGVQPTIFVGHETNVVTRGRTTTTTFRLTPITAARPGTGSAAARLSCVHCLEPVDLTISSVASAHLRVWLLRLGLLIAGVGFIVCVILAAQDRVWTLGAMAVGIVIVGALHLIQYEDGVRLGRPKKHSLRYPGTTYD